MKLVEQLRDHISKEGGQALDIGVGATGQGPPEPAFTPCCETPYGVTANRIFGNQLTIAGVFVIILSVPSK